MVDDQGAVGSYWAPQDYELDSATNVENPLLGAAA